MSQTVAEHVDVESNGSGPLADLPDERLVELAQEAESDRRRERAFAELTSRYKDRIIRKAQHRYGLSQPAARGVAQESFGRLWEHLHRYEPDKKFSSWIWTIATNLMKNRVRDRRRSPVQQMPVTTVRDDGEEFSLLDTMSGRDVEQPSNHTLSPAADPEADLEAAQVREAVEEAISNLPNPERRETIELRLKGHTYEEISQMTDTKLGTVKSRLGRVRHALLERLEKKGVEVEAILDGE